MQRTLLLSLQALAANATLGDSTKEDGLYILEEDAERLMKQLAVRLVQDFVHMVNERIETAEKKNEENGDDPKYRRTCVLGAYDELASTLNDHKKTLSSFTRIENTELISSNEKE